MAYHLLENESVSPEEADAFLREKGIFDRTSVKVAITEMQQQEEAVLSPAYLEILSSLDEEVYSEPIFFPGRESSTTICRIFCLSERVAKEPASFAEVQDALNDQLINEALTVETNKYLATLREENQVSASLEDLWIPEGFQPFYLN